MKNFIDENFLRNKWKYISQSILVTFFVGIILVFFDFVVKLVIAASLGATCFIIFTIPHKNASKSKYILGGYAIGVVVGGLCAMASAVTPRLPPSVWGAVAIGLTMFLMVSFNLEHPPACALSLGFVLTGFNAGTVITVFCITGFLLGVRRLLKNTLIDLI